MLISNLRKFIDNYQLKYVLEKSNLYYLSERFKL